jgi:hypothetical protein
MARDILVAEIPTVLHADLYAVGAGRRFEMIDPLGFLYRLVHQLRTFIPTGDHASEPSS